MVIWKFLIRGGKPVEMPRDAKVLCVQMQRQQPCVWALVNSKQKEKDKRFFEFKGTGEEFDDRGLSYIGTIQEAQGALIWHIYENINKRQEA